jgi:hypothetical protein
MSLCWWLLKPCLLGAIAGAIVAVPHLYRRVDEEIRRRVEERLAQHYTGLSVTIRSARFREGEGIELRGLKFQEPAAEGPRAEVLQVEEVFLSCKANLEELIRGEPNINRVLVRRPRLRITCQADGTWSAGGLLPLPKFSRQAPEVTIEDGALQIVDATNDSADGLILRDANFSLTPCAPSPQSPLGSRLRQLRGSLSSDFVRQVAVEGFIDPHEVQCDMAGSVEGLELSPELRENLPKPLADKLVELASLHGVLRLGFQVSYHPSQQPICRFDVSGRLSQGSMDDPRLPHSLTDLRAAFRINNGGLAIDGLSAASGPTSLRIASYRRAGFDRQSAQWLEAEVRDLELDRRFLDILPTSLQNQWYNYLPSGQIHANLKLAFDGQTWQPELAVDCAGVSFSYHKFPYRLQQGKGTLILKEDTLQVNLTAHGGNEPVRIWGKIAHPLSGPVGDLEVKASDVPLDEKLLSSLPPKARSVVHSLNPHGLLDNVYVHVWRDKAEEPWRRQLTAQVTRSSIRYEKFPYPLSNIQGVLEMLDDHWTFRHFSGTNDTGLVTCNGRLDPTPEGSELALNFSGANVPLEEELRDALSHPNMQQVWNDLRLQGMVNLNAEVHYRTGQPRPTVVLHAEPISESTSIEPVHFPYRLEKLQGTLVYHDGQVTVEKLRGEHGETMLSSAARCTFLPDGSWHLCLEGLAVDRLRLDRELNQALPERLRRMAAGLNPTGPMNVRGTFEFARGGLPGDPLTSRWDLDVGFCQGGLDFGMKLENLNGALKLIGDFDGQRFQSRGEMDLDAVSCRNLQVTRVQGPFWIDDDEVLFGTDVDRHSVQRTEAAPARPPRPLTAQLFGGTVYGNGWVALGPVPRYELSGTLAQADLSRCAQEMLPGRQNISGQIMATVNLRGSGRSLNALSGNGSIHLRNADIYELPVMVSLLKILSIREPDRTAFSESDIRFRIEGPHLYFDPINFNGDAISLEGKGEMDFQSAINLRFRAQLGRNELKLPMVREVLGGASEQIMVIHVEGTLQDPQMRREPFPVVHQAIEEFRSDREKPIRPGGLFPQARRWKPEALRVWPKTQ